MLSDHAQPYGGYSTLRTSINGGVRGRRRPRHVPTSLFSVSKKQNAADPFDSEQLTGFPLDFSSSSLFSLSGCLSISRSAKIELQPFFRCFKKKRKKKEKEKRLKREKRKKDR
jgi:hypothetical protein